MVTLTKQQADLMFRKTDKRLFSLSFYGYEYLENNVGGSIDEILQYFHCNEVYQLDLNDDYWKGIRANTFCIEVGWSEVYSDRINGREYYPVLYIVTANHKGTRMLTMHEAEGIPWFYISNNQEGAGYAND